MASKNTSQVVRDRATRLALAVRGKRQVRCLALILLLLGCATVTVRAHSAPYSTVEVYLRPHGLTGSLTAHIFDIAHDLKIDPPERLLEPGTAAGVRDRIVELITPRLQIRAGRAPIVPKWGEVTALPATQSLQLPFTAALSATATPAAVSFHARMFPYDPSHQTFINVYEGDEIFQQQFVFNTGDGAQTYYADTREGRRAVVAAFVPAGVRHILNGPADLVFLAGLLLVAGQRGSLLRLVTAFIAGHALTLSLAAGGIMTPAPRMIEAALALTVVFVGVDNVLVLIGSRGVGVREWVAFAFGLVRGFGYVGGLQELRFPRGTLGWSLFSFSAGVELGQILVIALAAVMFVVLARHLRRVQRQLAYVGSLAVIAVGLYWFV